MINNIHVCIIYMIYLDLSVCDLWIKALAHSGIMAKGTERVSYCNAPVHAG